MDSEKKLMIQESGISEYPEYEVKAKIRNLFVNEKTIEKYSGNIYEKKMGDGREYILFRIDVYFFEYLLAV